MSGRNGMKWTYQWPPIRKILGHPSTLSDSSVASKQPIVVIKAAFLGAKWILVITKLFIASSRKHLKSSMIKTKSWVLGKDGAHLNLMILHDIPHFGPPNPHGHRWVRVPFAAAASVDCLPLPASEVLGPAMTRLFSRQVGGNLYIGSAMWGLLL